VGKTHSVKHVRACLPEEEGETYAEMLFGACFDCDVL
jgi:hypothetical protein